METGPYHPSHRRFAGRVAAIVLVIAVLVFALLYTAQNGAFNSGSSSGPVPPACAATWTCPVNVSKVVVVSPDNACGMNGAVAGGFMGGPGTQNIASWELPLNGASVPCRVGEVRATPSDFYLTGDLSLNVTSPGIWLEVWITSPANYTGVLTLTVR